MAPGKREPRNITELEPSSFGAQLRRLRMDAGLSQEELGEAIGTDQTRISAYERNRFRPNEDIILEIARVLNVKPGVLLESSQWGGALPIGSERRERLIHIEEPEWQAFDRYLDSVEELTPEQRARFEEGFRHFLSTWKDFQTP